MKVAGLVRLEELSTGFRSGIAVLAGQTTSLSVVQFISANMKRVEGYGPETQQLWEIGIAHSDLVIQVPRSLYRS